MNIPGPLESFKTAAATQFSLQEEGRLNILINLPKRTDDELDEVMLMAVKNGMRLGKSEVFFWISERERNLAALHVVAQRWRLAGYNAEVNPRTAWYWLPFRVSSNPCIRVRWNLSELAAEALQAQPDSFDS